MILFVSHLTSRLVAAITVSTLEIPHAVAGLVTVAVTLDTGACLAAAVLVSTFTFYPMAS